MMRKLPLGIQDFGRLRRDQYLYVDKTQYIYELVTSGAYYFLSRPRRFGKSLLVSTLAELFRGKRELFSDLWIADRVSWESFPVVHISMSSLGSQDNSLTEQLYYLLEKVAQAHQVKYVKAPGLGMTLMELLERIANKSSAGRVVLLIDEYDKPLLNSFQDHSAAERGRLVFQDFYSAIKDCDSLIRFFFATGVSRFHKLSIFSDLNNLTDISRFDDFHSLTGYTAAEVSRYFGSRISEVAARQRVTPSELLNSMTQWYNGYSWNGVERVFNPYSVLSFLKAGQFDNYWFSSGTPSFLPQVLQQKLHYRLEEVEVGPAIFESSSLEQIDYIALLFQTGYLTIKKVDGNVFTLGYPNKEVKDSLLEHLLATVSGQGTRSLPIVQALKRAIEGNKLDHFIDGLNALLASVPYQLYRGDREATFHALIFVALKILGVDVECEVSTSQGRIDAVIETGAMLYLFEFKVDSTAARALSQIKSRDYARQFQTSGKSIVLVGVNFASETKLIDSWVAESWAM